MTLEPHYGRNLHFIWDPYLNATHIPSLSQAWGRKMIFTGGLWHARYLNHSFLDVFERQVWRLASDYHTIPNTYPDGQWTAPSAPRLPIFLPIAPPSQANLSFDRSLTLAENRTSAVNERLRSLSKELNLPVMWSTMPMTVQHETAFELDGLHTSNWIASTQVNILLNYFCNTQDAKPSQGHYCCSSYDIQFAAHRRASLGILCFVLVVWSLDTTRAAAFGSGVGSNKALKATAVLSAATLYCCVADRTKVFERSNKLTDENLFVSFCCLAGLVGLATMSCSVRGNTDPEKQRSELDDALSRQQTDEWKGWMQIVILLYHYFGMSRVAWVYRLVRILVASYLFLTGYGHARYFVVTNDFSSRRLITVLIRTNLLSCILPFVMDTTHHFYYFPALSSFWFAVIWLTMYRTDSEIYDVRRALSRICMSVVVVHLLLSASGFQHFVFSTLKAHHLPSIDQHEFYFRTRLDRFVPYLGMITAILQHQPRSGLLAERRWIRDIRIRRTFLVTLSFLSLLGYLAISSHCRNKHQFNLLHPFISIIPISAYILIRNMTSTLRNCHSCFFAWFGRHSLETYILQYHIWLGADTKGLLRLGILDSGSWYGRTTTGSWGFWAEAAIITVVFLWASSHVSEATVVLTKWTIGIDREDDSRSSIPISESRVPTRSSWHRFSLHLSNTMCMRLKILGALFFLWQLNRASQ